MGRERRNVADWQQFRPQTFIWIEFAFEAVRLQLHRQIQMLPNKLTIVLGEVSDSQRLLA